MSDHVFVEPGKSNPGGDDEGHWKIMLEENGKSRHLNDGTSYGDAANKAQRAAVKRGVEFKIDRDYSVVVNLTSSTIPVKDFIKKDYMDVQPPRGAPQKGDVVQFTAPDGTKYEGEVVGYLAEQFIIEFMAPTQRIVHMNEDWVKV